MVVFVFGVVIQSAYAAAVAVILLAGAARFHTYWTGDPLGDSPLWNYGVAGAGIFAAGAFVLTLFFTVLGTLRGAAAWLLKGLSVRDGKGDELRQVRNVVDALSVGLGCRPRRCSSSTNRHRTRSPAGRATGARSSSPRVCSSSRGRRSRRCAAHEMAQLHSPDAKLVGAAFMALLRARNAKPRPSAASGSC